MLDRISDAMPGRMPDTMPEYICVILNVRIHAKPRVSIFMSKCEDVVGTHFKYIECKRAKHMSDSLSEYRRYSML